jgi:hypothetical protein
MGIRASGFSLIDDAAMKTLSEAVRQDPSVKKVAETRRTFPSKFEVRVVPRVGWVALRTTAGYVLLDDEAVRLEGEFRECPGSRTGLTIIGTTAVPPAPGRVWAHDDIKAAFDMIRVVLTSTVLRSLVAQIDVSNLGGRIVPAEPEIQFVTRSGCRIHWGSVSAANDAFELTASEKLSNLAVILQRYPSLSGLDYVKIYIRNRPTVRRNRPPGAMNQS